MIPVLSRQQMHAFDRYFIDVCKVPSLVLMENAGRGAADVASRMLRSSEGRVVLVVGLGNNGGDGYVVARHMLARGADVRVFLLGDPQRCSADCAHQRAAYLGVGGQETILREGDELGELEAAFSLSDLLVDAIFGTGLSRAMDPYYQRVIAAINRAPIARLAIDLPSGLDANNGTVCGACVMATETATFAHLKAGLLTPMGVRHAGRVHVLDLGVPSSLMPSGEATCALVESSDIGSVLRPREVDAHKFALGSVLVLAGSLGKSGAALLAARGALRAGAGVVMLASWPEIHASLDGRLPEIMVVSLDRTALREQLRQLMAGRTAVVVGPGFGLDAHAQEVIDEILTTFEGPVVLDADALTVYRGRAKELATAKGQLVLTPHPGEMARLLEMSVEDVEHERFSNALVAAKLVGAVVVLKGACTVVAAPPDQIAINTTGNPVLATAGSGDVLAGMIGALACSLPPFVAALAAVHMHGLSGDLATQRRGDRGILASELADLIPEVFSSLEKGEAVGK